MELFHKCVVPVSRAIKDERLFEKAMVPDAGELSLDVLSPIGAWALSERGSCVRRDLPDHFAPLREDCCKKQKEAVRKSIVKMLEMFSQDGEPIRRGTHWTCWPASTTQPCGGSGTRVRR